MSGANTINANGGSLTLDESNYTDPSGGHVPAGVVINNEAGLNTIFAGVSWAYVDESSALTTDSLVVNNFTQGDFLDYHPADTLTAVDGTEESLETLTPNGSIVDLGTYTVDGLTGVGIEVPVIETMATSGAQSQTDSRIDLLIVPGPSTTAFQVSDLTLASDGAGGIVIGSDQACYCAGARIRTPGGDVAIEHLRPGDLVLTARGRKAGPQPVAWIGHRTVDCTNHPRPEDVLPVRVQAHAFGPGRPERDLWLSPDHAVFTGGVLIPIRYLVNGASVAQQRVDRVTYFHLELPRHDVVLAEGLPAESFLDTGNRAAFVNGGTVVQMAPDFARRVWDTAACAPLVTAGAAVTRTRKRLIRRLPALGHALTTDPCPAFRCDGAPAAARRFGADGRSRTRRPDRGRCGSAPAWRGRDFDPQTDDTRRLGVAMLALRLDGRDVRLADPVLGDGWHADEDTMRWTNGDAAIDVTGARLAELRLVSWLTYRDDTPAERGRAKLRRSAPSRR